ncbi:MAG: class I SAM-dependent methyltransferase [Candidatus Dormibacteria bacterium]|jgi:ubiquinone/menaquinone biosynthesis C-methylase UbiE|nr:class I SAM-dependent methyltransferase [Chloroflexota bacterium]
MSTTPRRRFQLPEMEGRMARWYARNRGSASQLAECRREAARLTAGLPDGATALEVAPGPGYHAVEMARSGRLQVTGLDISRTMVEIATENARQAGVDVVFRRGDVSAMPFGADAFDLIVCQAAFKNFKQPARALDEMHRVLRPGGTAVIQDMNNDASNAAIAEEVRAMKLSRFNGFMTRLILSTLLRRRAYSPARFERLVAQTAFRTCHVETAGIGLEVRLTKVAG